MANERQNAWAVVTKVGEFDENDINYLRQHLSELTNMTSYGHAGAIVRTNIETIASLAKLNASVQRFDVASAELIATTNVLTTRILVLTYVAVGLGAIQVLISVLLRA